MDTILSQWRGLVRKLKSGGVWFEVWEKVFAIVDNLGYLCEGCCRWRLDLTLTTCTVLGVCKIVCNCVRFRRLAELGNL
jgi:hypothetical protein